MIRGMAVLKTFRSEAEASVAQTRLAAEGIPASVERFSRYRAMAGGGFTVQVPTGQVARARMILQLDNEIDMDEYVSGDDETYVRCPACSSVNVRTAPLKGGYLLLALFSVGVALFFMKRDRTCAKCGHVWKG